MVGGNTKLNASPSLADYLKKYDTLFLIDDSYEVDESDVVPDTVHRMDPDTIAHIINLVSQAAKRDRDGVDVRFGNAEQKLDKVKSSMLQKLRTTLGQIEVTMGDPSNVMTTLQEILEEYLDTLLTALKAGFVDVDRVKPLNIMVMLTAKSFAKSIEQGIENVETVIKQITSLRPPRPTGAKNEVLIERRIGIQFVRLAEDDDMIDVLSALDTKFQGDDDVIDTVPWPSNFSEADLDKILAGAIKGEIDARGEQPGNTDVFAKEISVVNKVLITAASKTNSEHRVNLTFVGKNGTSRKSLLGNGVGQLIDPASALKRGMEVRFTGEGLLTVTISRLLGGGQTQLGIKPEVATSGATLEIDAGDSGTGFNDVVVSITRE